MICGIPQGSTLGPLLFLLYVNDLPLCSNFNSRLFADDTNLFLTDRNINNLQTNTNLQLTKIYQWMQANQLSVNFKKTKFMLIGPKSRNKPSLHISMNNNVIQETHTFKYLGLNIDKNLRWKPHIELVNIKISKYVGIFYKFRHYISTDILKLTYNSLIYPYLQYCILSWGSAKDTTLKPLSVTLNKIIKAITFSKKRDHVTPLYCTTNSNY